MATDRIDLVDEDDAGRILLGLFEHVADAAGANADKHFNEVRARYREERHIGFAGNGARQQRLAGAGRADQQNATWNAAAEPLKFSGIAQEFDDLLEIELGFIDSGNVLKRNAAMRFGEQFGAALAEAERLAAGALHLPRQENPNADQRHKRQPRNQQRNEPGYIVRQRTRGDLHAFIVEALHQIRVAGRIGLKAAPVGVGAVDLRTLDEHVAHAPLIDIAQKLRERNVLRGRALTRILKQREQGKQEQDNDHPQGEIAQIGIHLLSLVRGVCGHARTIRARKSWRLHVPCHCQCRQRDAPCQGNPPCNSLITLFRKGLLAAAVRRRDAARWAANRLAGARSTTIQSLSSVTSAPASVRRSREAVWRIAS